MTYVFKCHETSDVLMMQPDGDAILRIIGREPTTKGIIEAGSLPAAIMAIERAIEEEEQRHVPEVEDDSPQADSSADEAEVSLRQRTWPLLQMMKSAQAASIEIVWGV